MVVPSRFRLRRVFGPLVRWVAGGFIRIGASPNVISLLGFLVALFAALILFFFQWFVIYGLLVFCAGLLDGVDGEVARRTDRISLTGGFLDSLLDRLADVIIVLPFLWVSNPFPQWGPTWFWVAVAITGSLLVSYVRSRAEAAGVIDTDVGLAARSERLFILVIASILVLLFPPAPYLGLLFVAILSHLTVAYRVIYYRRQISTVVPPKP